MILRVPPLRERSDDIPILIAHFLKKKARNGIEKTISKEALTYLTNYTWPGNVRELENTIENLIFMSKGSCINLVDLERLSLERDPFLEDTASPASPIPTYSAGGMMTKNIKDKAKEFGLYEAIEMLKTEILNQVTEENQGKVNKTIQDLKISTNTYYKLIKPE